MPCTYEWLDRSVLKRFSGFVDGEEFLRSAERVAQDVRFDHTLIIYNNFLGASGHSVDARTYARVAAARLGSSLTNPNFRVAFIATGESADQLTNAVASMKLNRSFDPVVVQSMVDAERWFSAQPPLNGARAYRSH